MKKLSDVKFSTLDLVPVRENGSAGQSLRNSLDLAQHAEKFGYTRFWVAEHHNMDGIASSATSVLLGYLAGGTSTIRVGSGGVMLPNHAPLVIAEQIGTPVEVYEKPASRFVASFIGSPAMNLLEGRISDDGGRFELAGGMQLPTNHEHRRHAGRKMTLGIRPEHFILSSQAQGGIPLLMDTLEILGADNLAHGRWGEQKLVVRLPHQQRPAAGSTLWLHLPLEHLHLFDGETGQRA